MSLKGCKGALLTDRWWWGKEQGAVDEEIIKMPITYMHRVDVVVSLRGI